MDNNYCNLDELGYLSNAFSAYLQYIKNFPPLPREEIYKLGLKSMSGDEEAREKLALHHLAFVVFIAKPFFQHYQNVDPMDIVQYGNEGLMKAISMYDPHTGALTTYAEDWIKQKITNNLDINHSDLKIPINVQKAKRKYSKIMYEILNQNKSMPSDDELCDILKVSKDTLSYIKELYNTTVVSINKEVNKDGDALEYFVEDKEVQKPEDIISEIDKFEMLIALKTRLDPFYYYVFYMRNVVDNTTTLEDLAESVGVKGERIRQIELKAKEKAKYILSKKSPVFRDTIKSLKFEYKTKFYKLDEHPLTPKQIIDCLYYRRFFSDVSKDIVVDLFLHKQKLTEKERAEKYSITVKEYRQLLQRILKKIKTISKRNKDDYLDFSKKMTETYKSHLFDIDLTNNADKYDPKDILNRYSNKTFEEIKNLYGDDFENLPTHTKELLKRFFIKSDYPVANTKYIEKEVNLALFNCKCQNTRLSPTLLYPTYLKYKNRFSEEQQLLLECYFFNKLDKKLYDESKHSNQRSVLLVGTLQKLEKFYFGLENIFLSPGVTKEIYEEVLESYGDKITSDRKRILNLYYGVGRTKMSLSDIVSNYGLDYNKTHDFLKNARYYIYNLYLSRTQKNEINKDIYSKYIMDCDYKLTDETRRVLKMHVIDEMDYDEISQVLGLDKKRISDLIGNGIRKIDFYRFGIIKVEKIDDKMLDKFLNESKSSFNEIDIVIIKLRLFEHLEDQDIYKVFSNKDEKDYSDILNKYPILNGDNDVTLNYIKAILKRFSSAYKSFLVNGITLSNEEINALINKRPLESVISDEEKRIISFSLGLKNSFNPSGKVFSSNEIKEIMNLKADRYYDLKQNGMKKLKLHSIGELNPENIYMPLDDLERAVNDRHVPISDKERLIINHICNLNGHEHLSFKDLTNLFNETDSSLRRRYQRAIVTIKKYYMDEVDAQIDYEIDLLPNLKYFNKTEKIYIKEYFANGLSFNNIAKKYSVTVEQVITYIDSIYAKIYQILNEKKKKMFDYDYADAVLDNADLPFFGNREVAKEAYTLAFGGQSMYKIPLTEVAKMMNTNISDHTLNSILTEFMISICKYRMGIKKDNTFSHEQIVDYYNRHKNKLSKENLLAFLHYFDRYKKTTSLISTYVSDSITYLLLKETKENRFKIYTTNRNEVLTILKNKKYRLDKKVRHSLMQLFDISEREFLTGQEINHVIRTLYALDLKIRGNERGHTLNIAPQKRDI